MREEAFFFFTLRPPTIMSRWWSHASTAEHTSAAIVRQWSASGYVTDESAVKVGVTSSSFT